MPLQFESAATLLNTRPRRPAGTAGFSESIGSSKQGSLCTNDDMAKYAAVMCALS